MEKTNQNRTFPAKYTDYWVMEKIDNLAPWAKGELGLLLQKISIHGYATHGAVLAVAGHIGKSIFDKATDWNILQVKESDVTGKRLYSLTSQGHRIAGRVGLAPYSGTLIWGPEEIFFAIFRAAHEGFCEPEFFDLFARMSKYANKWVEGNTTKDIITDKKGVEKEVENVPQVGPEIFRKTDFFERFLEISGFEFLRRAGKEEEFLDLLFQSS